MHSRVSLKIHPRAQTLIESLKIRSFYPASFILHLLVLNLNSTSFLLLVYLFACEAKAVNKRDNI